MPVGASSLVNDENGEPASGVFSYRSVVGMLIYLSEHIHTYVSLFANICAQYKIITKRSHKLA